MFEVFVDNLSSYRVDTNKETLAVLLNNEFGSVNTKDSTKDNNIISPYPNAKALLQIMNSNGETRNNDFILE